MTINDLNIQNNLERVVADDINERQTLASRMRGELARAMTRRFTVGHPPTELGAYGIASGLKITTSGTDCFVGAGMLCQWGAGTSLPDVPAIGTLDSSMRVGLNMNATTLAIPASGSNVWYLVQARVIQSVTLSESRDIYNPSTPGFAPATVDKRKESTVQAVLKAGTATDVPAPDSGYVRIGAFLMVTGGGSVNDYDTFQLVTQVQDLANTESNSHVCKRTDFKFQTDNGHGVATDRVKFSLSAEVNGVKLFAKTDTSAIDSKIRKARFYDTAGVGNIAVDGYWWYVYLGAPDAYTPENFYTDGGTDYEAESKGFLVVSRIPPNDFGLNSAAMTTPSPLSETIGVGQAACVAVFRASGVVEDIYSIQVKSSGVGVIHRQTINGATFDLTNANEYLGPSGPTGTGSVNYNLATLGTAGTEIVPKGVGFKVFIESKVASAIETTPPAYGVEINIHWANDGGNGPVAQMPATTYGAYSFEIAPVDVSDLLLTVASVKRNASGGVEPMVNACASVYNAGFDGIIF
jgi:hypothetical protein